MKYIVNNKKNIDRMDDNELLIELLKMRGVENPLEMLHLTHKVLYDANDFNNIDEALELFHDRVEINKDKVHIIIDSDCDGLTSASMMWLYIKELVGVEATFSTHEGKQHGLYREIVDTIPEDTKLLIIPDAGSSDYEWHTILHNRGLDILILDHHNFLHDSNYAVIVNDQDGSYKNTNLTGVGVVFKFLDKYDEVYGHDIARNHLGLLCLGQIADLSDVRESETRFLILESLKYMVDDSKLLKEIVKANNYNIQDKITIYNVGWYVAPMVNACFRQGTVDDKLDMFKAMCNFEEERVHVPSKKSKNNPNKEPIIETLQENVVRRMKSLKNKQDEETKGEADILDGLVKQQGVESDKIIILDVTGVLNSTHTGLAANTLAKRYQRPVLLLNHNYEDSNTYGGSGRNYDKFAIDNLADFLHRSGLIECKGHDDAFGISLPLDNLEPLKQWIEEELKSISIEPVYHVDFEIPIYKLKDKHIRKVGQYQDMFGGKGMNAPLFAITDIVVDSSDIVKNKSLVKFTIEKNGEYITFVKKFAKDDWYNELIHATNRKGISRNGDAGNKKLEIVVLGKFIINEYEGRQYTQVEIVEIESKVATETRRRKRF